MQKNGKMCHTFRKITNKQTSKVSDGAQMFDFTDKYFKTYIINMSKELKETPFKE